MSEADSPKHESEVYDSSLSIAANPLESVVESAQGLATDPQTDAQTDWQTVDFPGALSVDAIPNQLELADATEQVSVAQAEVAAIELPAIAPVADESGHGMLAETGAADGLAIAAPEFDASELASALAIEASEPVDLTNGTVPAPAELVGLIQQLRQENLELRDRAIQLEQDLAQEQIELQLTKAHLVHHEEKSDQVNADAIASKETAAALREQVSRLLQELELSNQANQRQQILVETLTKQLESSQERIAQLERECALAQQRYNEQLQQLLHSEDVCRDLRMRLHRQQQQTLQFKAALEKSLEMTAPGIMQSVIVEAQTAEAGAEVAGETLRSNLLAHLFAVQKQPVQPWSASGSAGSEGNGSQASAVTPFAKFLQVNPLEESLSVAESAPAESITSNDCSLTAEPLVDSQESDQPVFDLTPFLAAGETGIAEAVATESLNPAQLTAHAAKPDGVAASDQAPAIAMEDGLWEDLARLIDAVEAGVEAVAGAQIADQGRPIDVPVEMKPAAVQEPTPAVVAATTQPTTAKPTTHRALDLTALTFLTKPPLSQKLGASPESVRIAAVPPAAIPGEPAASSAPTASSVAATQPASELTDVSTPPSWPSPVVYPGRPPKRRGSLSSIDLPTFPR